MPFCFTELWLELFTFLTNFLNYFKNSKPVSYIVALISKSPLNIQINLKTFSNKITEKQTLNEMINIIYSKKNSKEREFNWFFKKPIITFKPFLIYAIETPFKHFKLIEPKLWLHN